jgi:hypothetical protein
MLARNGCMPPVPQFEPVAPQPEPQQEAIPSYDDSDFAKWNEAIMADVEAKVADEDLSEPEHAVILDSFNTA